jgi:hypothetical protein
MTAVDIQVLWPVQNQVGAYHSERTLTLDSNPTSFSFTYQPAKSGSVEEVELKVGTVTTDESITLEIQRLDAAGDADGTAITNGSIVVAAGNLSSGWNAFTFATAPTVVKGEHYAIIWKWTSTVGSTQFKFATAWGGLAGYPYVRGLNGATWADQDNSGRPMARVKFTDGSYPLSPGFDPAGASGQFPIATNTTAKEAGIRFKLPFDCKIAGIVMVIDQNSKGVGSPAFTFYDDGDAPGAGEVVHQIGTIGAGEDDVYMRNSASSGAFLFVTDAVILADTWYKLTLDPPSTQQWAYWYVDFGTAAYKEHEFGASALEFNTVRTNDDSAWIENVEQAPHWQLILKDIEIPVAGGGPAPIFFNNITRR